MVVRAYLPAAAGDSSEENNGLWFGIYFQYFVIDTWIVDAEEPLAVDGQEYLWLRHTINHAVVVHSTVIEPNLEYFAIIVRVRLNWWCLFPDCKIIYISFLRYRS